MLLPDKHITLAESILGLGAWVLERLVKPATLDKLWDALQEARETPSLPANHSLENLTLALGFLDSVGAISLNEEGVFSKCA